MRIAQHLSEVAEQAIEAALGETAPAALRPAKDPRHGDYQLSGVMPLAKRLGRPPRELAVPVAEHLGQHEAIAAAEVAGPGFVNLRLDPTWVGAAITGMLSDRSRDGVPSVARAKKVVVDFSSPNIAKQMHVGHLRSTIIGDAISRLLSFVGHEVVRDNHLGDWGTQFGLLIVGMRAFGDPEALERDAIQELDRVYKLAAARAKQDEVFAESARAELAKLQQGDQDNRGLWQQFVAATRVTLERAYERMEVHFDTWLGESAYQDRLAGVVQTLLERGVAREDQGAICVFFEGDKDLGKHKTPFIVRKKDGAFLYSTTDIATVQYRKEVFGADAAVYVVDQRQALHFKQLFAVVKLLGIEMELAHVGFGTVLGADGKPLKSRDGDNIKLSDLLDEAEQRASERIRQAAAERGEEMNLTPERLAELAAVVGIGAVKYVDLSQNRTSDYKFDWDKMISFKGNAGPYLQYAHARVHAVFRKAGVDMDKLSSTSSMQLEHPEEVSLAKLLLRFADAVHDAATSYQPHLVCDHLYALARQFSVFYEQCPVLKAQGETRATRLALCALSARQLARGLRLLGIAAPTRM